MKQEYTSKDTSINTVSAVYKQIVFPMYECILDYGGGKYDTNAEYVKKVFDCNLMVYDPYNRTMEHNKEVLNWFKKRPANFVVCSNVLNVIKEDKIILEILRNIYSLMSKNGYLYIKIYERDRTGIGCKTIKGWQRNQKLNDYIPFIRSVFGKYCEIKREKDILVVKKL